MLAAEAEAEAEAEAAVDTVDDSDVSVCKYLLF